MKIFYWVMGTLVLGLFLPSVVWFVLYLTSGNPEYGERARKFWQFSGVFAMLGLNLLIWGHLVVAIKDTFFS